MRMETPQQEPFKVDKGGKPMPSRKGGRLAIYPFSEMEVGDTFDAPRDMGPDHKGSDKRQHAIRSAASHYTRRHGMIFEVRCIDENTVRCKRVK